MYTCMSIFTDGETEYLFFLTDNILSTPRKYEDRKMAPKFIGS